MKTIKSPLRFVTIIIYIIIMVFFSACKKNEHTQKSSPKLDTISIKVFKIDTGGYGYDILINGKPYIHQDIIPTVAGRFSFDTYDDAYRVAVIVAQKLAQGISLPSVSLRELDSLGVLNKQVKEFQKKIALKNGIDTSTLFK